VASNGGEGLGMTREIRILVEKFETIYLAKSPDMPTFHAADKRLGNLLYRIPKALNEMFEFMGDPSRVAPLKCKRDEYYIYIAG
jgi:hypothetical protein